MKDLRNGSVKLAFGVAIALGLSETAFADPTPCNNPFTDDCILVIFNPPLFPEIIIRWPQLPSEMWYFDDSGGLVNAAGHVFDGNWTACQALRAAGMPANCSRLRLQTQTSFDLLQNLNLPNELQSAINQHSTLNFVYGFAVVALGNCYSDITRDPSECEENFAGAIENTCTVHLSTSPHLNNCLAGVTQLRSNFVGVGNNRAVSSWFGQAIGNDLSLGPFSVDITAFGTIPQVDQFNRALVDARTHINCQMFIGAWDENGCSGPFPPTP